MVGVLVAVAVMGIPSPYPHLPAAWAIINEPVKAPVYQPTDEKERIGLGIALVKLAVDQEILGPDQGDILGVPGAAKWWPWAMPGGWEWGVQTIRNNYHSLKDAPRVGDARRFPSADECNKALAFNYYYHIHITGWTEYENGKDGDCSETWHPGLRDLYPHRDAYWRVVIAENEQLARAWNYLSSAQRTTCQVSVRRDCLKRLRDLIGEEAYNAGRMPPAAPYWRFNEMK